MEDRVKCPRGSPPVVRLALKRERCPKGVAVEKLNSPTAVHTYLKAYGCEAQEWSIAVGLNSTAEPLGIHEIALGGMGQVEVDFKVVFSGLLLMGATAFIFCHNHPSGSPQPSAADQHLTENLNRAGELLGIRLLDHIIVAGSQFFSFRQQGLLK